MEYVSVSDIMRKTKQSSAIEGLLETLVFSWSYKINFIKMVSGLVITHLKLMHLAMKQPSNLLTQTWNFTLNMVWLSC